MTTDKTPTIAMRIRTKLTDAFDPVRLDLIDDSEQHRGHGGYRTGGETHFRLLIVSDAFAGQTRVTRQRTIYSLLQAEMDERIHALEMAARTPAEQAQLAQLDTPLRL